MPIDWTIPVNIGLLAVVGIRDVEEILPYELQTWVREGDCIRKALGGDAADRRDGVPAADDLGSQEKVNLVDDSAGKRVCRQFAAAFDEQDALLLGTPD